MLYDNRTIIDADIPLIDAHVHMRSPGLYDSIRESMEAGGCSLMNIITTVQQDGSASCNSILRQYKDIAPDRFYIFGALDYRASPSEPFDPKSLSVSERDALAGRLGRQPGLLKAAGFDGIKLIESKPTSRRFLPFPLDSDIYAPFFAAAQSERMPLLWHVGDPPDFWNPDRIHANARARGWLYDRPGDPSLSTMRNEAENVLDRYPQLIVIFAHFYFLGHDLARARNMLHRYPNIYFDTTPGGQMYKFFNDRREEARNFFIEFQNRLIFGTDLASSRDSAQWPAQGASRLWRSLRAFFGTSDEMPDSFPGMHFLLPGESMLGLNLPKEVLFKLYSGNFRNAAGMTPSRLC